MRGLTLAVLQSTSLRYRLPTSLHLVATNVQKERGFAPIASGHWTGTADGFLAKCLPTDR